MDEKGVYAIARSIWEDADFMQQKYTQREAWMWLIGAAVWKEARVNIDGRRVTLCRGEFSYSVRFLATKWKWSKSTASRFLVALEKRAMIRDVGRDGVAVFSITKYNEFQVVGLPSGTADGTQDGTPVGQARDTCGTNKKHDKHDKHEGKEDSAAKAAAPPKPALPDWLNREAWAAFLEMRTKKRKPMTDRAKNSILSRLEKWQAKGHDPTAVLDRSTVNAWTDVFEPKPEQQYGKRSSPHETVYSVSRDLCAEILAGGEGEEGGGPDQAPLALLPARPN